VWYVVAQVLLRHGAKPSAEDKEGKRAGDLYPQFSRPHTKRRWEEERRGAAGEARWDYGAVMEATSFRYMRKAAVARRVREIAREVRMVPDITCGIMSNEQSRRHLLHWSVSVIAIVQIPA
jgi:hypothetical protein